MKAPRVIAGLVCFIALSCAAVDKAAEKWNGVYMLPSEVEKFSGECIELNNGEFRYWFYTDVISVNDAPRPYPLTGHYMIGAGTLTLFHDEIRHKTRTVDVVNGVKVLWRDDGLDAWVNKRVVHDYGVLIRAGDVVKDEKAEFPEPPSRNVIMTPEVRELERKRREAVYDDLPEPVRGLFQGRSSVDVNKQKRYQSAVEQYRAAPTLELYQQLVVQLNARAAGRSVDAYELLSEILPQKGAAQDALKLLVDAMAVAPGQNSLETVLMLFLERSGIREIDLEIPEAGLRMHLKRDENGKSYASQRLPGAAPELSWSDTIKPIRAACQKWCWEKLGQAR